MNVDADHALPSVERSDNVPNDPFPQAAFATTPHRPSERLDSPIRGNVSNRAQKYGNARPESSPSRTPFKTPRTRPSTPSTSSASRSPSVASMRNDRATPRLDKKRSVPNLSTQSSTIPQQPQFRRTSSNLNPATPVRTKSFEKPKMTPASVAKDYFTRELKTHSRTGSQVVVLTHDACYGHRFARPKSTKAMLSSIVERPERIHATLLGASTAYVRLGQRHCEGQNTPYPDRDISAIGVPFSICTSTRSIPLNHPSVTEVHGTKWMESLQIMCDSAEAKLAMGQKELARPIGHTRDSKGSTLPALHSGDLYLSADSLAALQGCLGGVCDAVDIVFQSELTRRAFVNIRPPGHHCSSDLPSGFCWLNNVHVGISYAVTNHGLTHAAIIDFDLHHGDGSQAITWDHNRNAATMQNPKSASAYKKAPIGYYSLHDINSFPCEYGDPEKVLNASTCLHNSHGQSIWNVHLESWNTLTDFWTTYESKYRILLEKARSFLQLHSDLLRQSGTEPKAAIFLSAGFDASQWESEFMQRHQVNVPTDFYATFTADVVQIANQPETGAAGRVISVLEGGYSDRALTSGVLSHLCGLTQQLDASAQVGVQHGLAKMTPEPVGLQPPTYDPYWWSSEQLDLIEAMVTGKMPPPLVKKDKMPSTFASPTHASTARMTEVAKERRTISAQLEQRLWLENAPPEPVPEVDWVTAAYELSRLLIPQDRQTQSHTYEELNSDSSRARRDRLSLAGLPISDPIEDKMQLRDRKPKLANLHPTQPQATSRTSNRRTTIAAASELPDPSAREEPRARRRSSAASSVLSSFQDLKLEDKEQPSRTQASSRAGSTAPSRAEPAVVIKKTRTTTKKPTSASTSPRKAKASAPPPRLGTVDEAQSSSQAANSAAEAQHDDVNLAKNTDAVNELTNGMKKISIKLKMPTEEQHNANKKLAEDASKPKTKLTRKPAVPKPIKAKVPANTKTSEASKIAVPASSTASTASLGQSQSESLQSAPPSADTQSSPATTSQSSHAYQPHDEPSVRTNV